MKVWHFGRSMILMATVSIFCVHGNAESLAAPDSATSSEASTVPANESKWSWSEGFVWRTVDENLHLRLGTYLMFDWATIGQSEGLDPIASPVGTKALVRDFQLDLRGQLSSNTLFRLQFDVNKGKPELQDNYFQQNEIPYLGSIRLGHFKEPFGLENSSSLRHLVFMERSLVDSLTPGRGIGISFSNNSFGERLAWTLGAFWDTNSVDKISESQAVTLIGRVTGLALCRDDNRELLHVGVSLSHRLMHDSLRYSARPEVNSAPVYLDTGDFSADAMTMLALESAYLKGPLLLQGELTWSHTTGAVRAEEVTLNEIYDEAVERYPNLINWLQDNNGGSRPDDSLLWKIPFDLDARGELTFWGVYGQAAYVLTGEQRPYDAKRGVFGAPVPEKPFSFSSFRGLGAWEVAARLSHLDLDDAYVNGGRETNLTLGVNWYMNKNTRMSLNYVHAMVDRDTYDGNMNALQMRMQIDIQPQGLNEYQPPKFKLKSLKQ